MRFKIELHLPFKNNLLPLNYQYELSAWIYKVLNWGDASFSAWLHNQGYLTNGKHYKLFTFSRLQVPQFKIQQDRLQILSSSVSLLLSFYTPVSAETFVSGLFRQQQFTLGDAQSRVSFEVSTIQAEPEPEFNSQTQFRLLSPTCVSTSRLQNGRNIPLYLAPEEINFATIFIQNLSHKIEAGQLPNSATATLLDLEEVNFTLLSKPVSKLVTIKAGTPQQTKVRGYLFDFELQAPKALLEVGYYAGFGEKNSLGFGCAEVLSLNRRR